MLHATVRNRKIHVKSPTTIPQGSKNVDVLLLDLDEEWDAMSQIVCIFSNTHTVEKVKKKVKTTIETKVEKKKSEDDTVLSTKTTIETFEEETDAEDDNKDFDETDQKTEVTEEAGTEEGTKIVTTVTTTIVTERPVSKTEETSTSIAMDVTDSKASVPYKNILDTVGQMYISVVGYGAKGGAIMTTVLSDSFWEIVESGEIEGGVNEEEPPGFYETALATLGEAKKAAEDAKATSDKLLQDAANGVFDGKDGKTPKITVGTVEASDVAEVFTSGTAQDVILNFRLPKGDKGDTVKAFQAEISANGDLLLKYSNGEVDNLGKVKGTDGTDGTNGKTAYQYAAEGGYKGTEESYADLLANVGNIEAVLDAIIKRQEGYITTAAEEVLE